MTGMADKIADILKASGIETVFCDNVKPEAPDTVINEIGASVKEAEIENVKKALETNNTETIKEATEKLTTVFYKMSEDLYKQNAANQANAEGGPTEGADGNVYDADYNVEDDGNNNNE